jgi:hypothetical protein
MTGIIRSGGGLIGEGNLVKVQAVRSHRLGIAPESSGCVPFSTAEKSPNSASEMVAN